MTTPHAAAPPTFDVLLVEAATWVVLATLGWGAVLVLAALVERLTSGRLPALGWAGCPPAARPLLLGLVGAVGISALLPGPAGAADDPADGPTEAPSSETTSGAALPVPTRPADDQERPPRSSPAPRPAPSARPVAATPGTTTLTVRAGDSLWSLAEQQLRPDAGPAAVAALVTRVHHLNRAVVGPDPDLVRPGQQLRFPATPPPQEAP